MNQTTATFIESLKLLSISELKVQEERASNLTKRSKALLDEATDKHRLIQEVIKAKLHFVVIELRRNQ